MCDAGRRGEDVPVILYQVQWDQAESLGLNALSGTSSIQLPTCQDSLDTLRKVPYLSQTIIDPQS